MVAGKIAYCANYQKRRDAEKQALDHVNSVITENSPFPFVPDMLS
jgi:hypothetical protein